MLESPREGVPKEPHEFRAARAAPVDVRRPGRVAGRPVASRTHRRGASRDAVTEHVASAGLERAFQDARRLRGAAPVGEVLYALRHQALVVHCAGTRPGVLHRGALRPRRQREARGCRTRSRRRDSVARHAAPRQGRSAPSTTARAGGSIGSSIRRRARSRRSGGLVRTAVSTDVTTLTLDAGAPRIPSLPAFEFPCATSFAAAAGGPSRPGLSPNSQMAERPKLEFTHMGMEGGVKGVACRSRLIGRVPPCPRAIQQIQRPLTTFRACPCIGGITREEAQMKLPHIAIILVTDTALAVPGPCAAQAREGLHPLDTAAQTWRHDR